MVGLTCVGIRLGLFSWRPETERRIQKEEWGSEEEEFRSTQGFHLGSRELFEQVQPHLLSRSVLSNSTRRLTPRGSATFLRLESVFGRAWSECEQRTWGVWRRGTPTSHRRQVVSLAVSCAPESPLSHPLPMSLGAGLPRRGCEVVSDSRWYIPNGFLWAHTPSRIAAQHPMPSPPEGNGNRQSQ